MYSSLNILSIFAAILPLCYGQTYSSCNPTTNTSCPADTALSSDSFTSDFTNSTSANSTDSWKTTAGSITYGSQGAEFIINEEGDAPTIQTNFYIFFGLVEVRMKAASGTGIISSIVLESDDLDEIDWEVIGGNTTSVETNYFGKGNTTSYDRAKYYSVDSPQTQFHTYTINWTSKYITWAIDGAIVRTLAYSDALNGKNFPQTPMNLRLGIWAGGDSSNSEGTIEWAGGSTDYSDAPFTMYVESVYIENFNTGKKYVYGDQTGDWTSIKIETTGNTTTTATNSTSTSAAAASASSASSAAITAVGSSPASVPGFAWALKAIVVLACFVQAFL